MVKCSRRGALRRRVRGRPRFGGRLGVAGMVPKRAAFALDAVAVMCVPASRRNELLTLFLELGYSLMAGAQKTHGHLFTAGLGLCRPSRRWRSSRQRRRKRRRAARS